MADNKRKKRSRKPGPVRRRRFPLRMVLVLLILAAAAFLVITIQSGFDLNIGSLFVRTEKTASSDAVLKQVKDISRLNTIEFIYKSVFPWDLLNPEIDMEELVKRYNRSGGNLSRDEIEMLSVYGLSKQAGIDLLRDPYKFAVIQVRIKAGYDFSEALPENMIEINPDGNSLGIRLPGIKITELIIEDSDSTDYGYPDLKVSPEQWKTLTSLMSVKVTQEAAQRGILDEADSRGREFIKELLTGTGYQNIYFID